MGSARCVNLGGLECGSTSQLCKYRRISTRAKRVAERQVLTTKWAIFKWQKSDFCRQNVSLPFQH